ncbi:phage baseplate assembly protein V [Variovorax sp. VNK109]|uniref:phage baseplate assembly protein V n=1 Tax=Variovorax sp. VNK109 TaxID=3400919 RepID=UPI003C093B3F
MSEETKALRSLGNRMRLSVARAVLDFVNDTLKLQAVQIQLQEGVVRDKVERFQNYGLTSVPLPGAEAVAVAVGGSTDHYLVIAVDDRNYRLQGLEGGEVALYDDLGHKVHLTRNGIVIDGAGHAVLMQNLTKLRVEANIEATGQIKDLCDTTGKTMASMRTAYNGHTHNETGGVTNGPNTAM